MAEQRARLVDDEAPLARRVDEHPELGLDRQRDHAHLLQVGLERFVILFEKHLRRRRVERDHRAVQLAQDLRQNHRRRAVVVIDDDLERLTAHRLQVEVREHILHVALGLLVSSGDPPHLVVGDTADVFAEVKTLEFALTPLVDIQAVVVEDANVRRARIDGRRLHVYSGHVIAARPVPRHGRRQHGQVDHVAARRDDPRHQRSPDHARRAGVVARERDLRPFGRQGPDRRAQTRSELGCDLDVDQTGEAVGAEEPSLPGAGPDDRFVDHGAGLDFLVRPDPHVGIDRRPRADRDVAADDGSFFEEAAVLDGDRPAHDRAPQAGVQTDVAVVPDDRVRDLHARVDRGVPADDCRPVHPGPASHLGTGADQRRAVDSRAWEDLGVRMDPRRLTDPLAWKLHLDAALEAVEVGLHVRGVAAHILPVAVGDPAKDVLAFFQQLRKYVARPVGDLAGPEELEHRRVEDVDARVGQVADDLAPAWLFDEPLHRAALVDDHDPVLERVRHWLQDDGGDGLAFAVEAGGSAEIDVRQRVARDDNEWLVQLLPCQHHRAGRSEGRVFDRVAERDTLLGAVAEVVADRSPEVLHCRHHVPQLVAAQVKKDVLHDRAPRNRDQGLGHVAGKRSQARPLAPSHDDCLHFPFLTTILCASGRAQTIRLRPALDLAAPH